MSFLEAEEDEREMKGKLPVGKTLAKTGNLCYSEPAAQAICPVLQHHFTAFPVFGWRNHPCQGSSPGFTIQHAAVHSVVQNQITLPGILHQNVIIHPKNPLTFGWFYTCLLYTSDAADEL